MPTIGVWELVVILLLVLGILGVGRLSEVGGAVGKGIRGFRKATTDERAAAPTVVHAATVATVPLPGVPLAASPAEATVLVENTCPSCATLNPTAQVFCGQCGTRLTLAA
jgi:sec-independent protein translocase protein TatA